MVATTVTTKMRILDAAETLFADSGIAAITLRDITGRAGVNLAAVNYHFGSRDALIEAVYRRRLQPLNEARLVRLDQLERRAGGKALRLEDIIRAFIEPVLQISGDPDAGGRRFIRLVAQSHAEPASRFARFFSEQYSEVLERFTVALTRTLPDLDLDELYWRMHFMIGATAYAIADSHLMRLIVADTHEVDISRINACLAPFLVAGFQAPATHTQESKHDEKAIRAR